MATTVSKYLAKCMEVRQAEPEYVHGKSSLTECDCIGMDKYSFRQNGVSFSTDGTNYSARKQIDNFRRISSAADLHVGDVVFKKRAPGEEYYDLKPRYQQGGADYNGDLNDYYHIGTVYSVSPLQIIHMTDPTAKTDTSIGKWSYAGNWKSQFISDAPSPSPEPEPQPTPPGPEPTPTPTPTPETFYAKVVSENGDAVNTRKGPGTGYPQAGPGKLPVGTVVEVLKERGDGWDYIKYVDKLNATWYCYMMAKFLQRIDEPMPSPEPDPSPEPSVEPSPEPDPDPDEDFTPEPDEDNTITISLTLSTYEARCALAVLEELVDRIAEQVGRG